MNKSVVEISGSIKEEHRILARAKNDTLAPAVWSSLMMAVAGMGDALLYAFLPVSSDALGMSIFTVGFLLSINKFTRLFTNRWIAYICQHLEIKTVFLAGVLLSSLTTLAYAYNPDFWVWVLSRVIWGFSFSALRFSTIQYANHSTLKGSAFGMSKGLQELGPMVAYWIGPILIHQIGMKTTFLIFSFMPVLLIPLFFTLPLIPSTHQIIRPFNFQAPDITDLWVLVSSFVAEGVLVVGVSHLIRFNFDNINDLLVAAAFYISIRRLINIVISPSAGWFSDRLGFDKIFQASCITLILGLVFIATGSVIIGIVLTFVGSAVNSTLLPIVYTINNSEQQNFNALTKMSTSRDIGSAIGSLSGLYLIEIVEIHITFSVICLILISLFLKIRKIYAAYE